MTALKEKIKPYLATFCATSHQTVTIFCHYLWYIPDGRFIIWYIPDGDRNNSWYIPDRDRNSSWYIPDGERNSSWYIPDRDRVIAGLSQPGIYPEEDDSRNHPDKSNNTCHCDC